MKSYRMYRPAALLVLVLTLLCHATTHAATRDEVLSRYTAARPLVILVNQNFAPYEFKNAQGQPDGYNVALMTRIMERLGIRYKFVIKSGKEFRQAFEAGEADLAAEPDNFIYTGTCYVGRAALANCRIMVARHKDAPQALTIQEIPESSIICFREHSVVYNTAIAAGLDSTRVIFGTTLDLLSEINSGYDSYFISAEFPIKRVITENKLENITMELFALPANTIRFNSFDLDLCNVLDEEFTLLQQSGEIDRLQNTWFYPERMTYDLRTLAMTLGLIGILCALAILGFNYAIHRRVRHHRRHLYRAQQMMEAAIHINGRDIIRFDFGTMTLCNVHGSFLPCPVYGGLTQAEYISHVHPDDRPFVMHHMQNIAMISHSDDTFTSPAYRWSKQDNADPGDTAAWRTVVLQAIFEYDNTGHRRGVICTVSDITDELEHTKKDEEASEIFYKIFDSALLGMAIYDPSGKMLESNHRMREIFHLSGDGSRYYYSQNLFNMPALYGVLHRSDPQELWTCTHIMPGTVHQKKYIELHVTPVRGTNGEVLFLLVAVRDITDDVATYRQHKIDLKDLREASATLKQSENELRILLQTARMRIWTIDEEERTISFFSAPGKAESKMTFEEFVSHAPDVDSRTNARMLVEQDPEIMKASSITIALDNFIMTFDKTQWYEFNVLGRQSVKGNNKGVLFGLTFNCTVSIQAQRKLEAEKVRATDSEHQKSVFLNSITHEIRTPLNSIVGFSEVLAMAGAEERALIIDTIRDNCDKLFRLTDDILTISAIDADDLTFDYQAIDFAQAFREEFEHLRIYTDSNSQVQYIQDNPYLHLIVRTDIRRVSQILTNFLGNAVKYTTAGFIRLGYSYDGGELWIYCQDSGAGISKDRQQFIFDRFMKGDSFVQGTGMGLSVCKSIAEAMGGRIGLDSEEGKGSTFYVVIPAPQA